MNLRLLPLSLALALAACGSDDPATGAADPANAPATSQTVKAEPAAVAAELEKLYADFWEASLELNPIQATFVGDPRYNDRLPNFFSAESRKEQHDFDQSWLDKVNAIDPEVLDGQARLSYDIFARERRLNLEGERFPGWMQPINQFGNFTQFFAQLGSGTSAQPFATVKDYDNWLVRANLAPALFDTAIANMREGVKAGIVQPKVLMVKVLPQLETFTKGKPESSVFWGPIERLPKDFSDADKARLTDAYQKLIAEQITPAFGRLHTYIKDEYLSACRDSVSLSALPDGEAWYAYNVKTQTTTDLTPAAIHQTGLDEVARIQGEMKAVMQQVAFKGDLKDFFKHVTTSKEFKFDTEQALLDAYNALRKRTEEGVPKLFSLTPKAGFEIRPVEAYRAASSSGGSYQGPSEDGKRPGLFYVNTYDLPSRTIWDMESLFLHEAIPGHHFQIALQQELTGLPKFRRFGGETAFAEGWGLYAESLGKDIGLYTDPYQYFGRLQAELWRAIRLVVDTGLHSKGWTRDQVIAYMLENSAASQVESVSEAERYIAIPAQALAYKIGELKIQELRKRAEQALGDKFDIKAFHAEVLQDGSVPLAVLETKIDRWIATQKG